METTLRTSGNNVSIALRLNGFLGKCSREPLLEEAKAVYREIEGDLLQIEKIMLCKYWSMAYHGEAENFVDLVLLCDIMMADRLVERSECLSSRLPISLEDIRQELPF